MEHNCKIYSRTPGSLSWWQEMARDKRPIQDDFSLFPQRKYKPVTTKHFRRCQSRKHLSAKRRHALFCQTNAHCNFSNIRFTCTVDCFKRLEASDRIVKAPPEVLAVRLSWSFRFFLWKVKTNPVQCQNGKFIMATTEKHKKSKVSKWSKLGLSLRFSKHSRPACNRKDLSDVVIPPTFRLAHHHFDRCKVIRELCLTGTNLLNL